MGVISINSLRVQANHGVLTQERRVGNTFQIDLSMNVPSTCKAMESDDLHDTLNYAEAVEVIKKEMSIPSNLLETVAGRIITALHKRFPGMIEGGEITISKLAPPIACEMDSVSYSVKF